MMVGGEATGQGPLEQDPMPAMPAFNLTMLVGLGLLTVLAVAMVLRFSGSRQLSMRAMFATATAAVAAGIAREYGPKNAAGMAVVAAIIVIPGWVMAEVGHRASVRRGEGRPLPGDVPSGCIATFLTWTAGLLVLLCLLASLHGC